MKTGKIVLGIDKKVYFEYYELPKPLHLTCGNRKKDLLHYTKMMKEYEASKRLIEVGNKYFIADTYLYNDLCAHIADIGNFIKNNTPCKTEITGNKATIVELIK